jgi:hypothetical protein
MILHTWRIAGSVAELSASGGPRRVWYFQRSSFAGASGPRSSAHVRAAFFPRLAAGEFLVAHLLRNHGCARAKIITSRRVSVSARSHVREAATGTFVRGRVALHCGRRERIASRLRQTAASASTAKRSEQPARAKSPQSPKRKRERFDSDDPNQRRLMDYPMRAGQPLLEVMKFEPTSDCPRP